MGQRLVKLAYKKAPSETIDTLIRLIDNENQNNKYIFVTRQFKKCWDDSLMSIVLKKAQETSLKPECMGNLLEELLEQDFIPAKEFVKSLINYPLPSAETERKRGINFDLTEKQLADFYIWLTKKYPYDKDTKCDQKVDYRVRIRERSHY